MCSHYEHLIIISVFSSDFICNYHIKNLYSYFLEEQLKV